MSGYSCKISSAFLLLNPLPNILDTAINRVKGAFSILSLMPSLTFTAIRSLKPSTLNNWSLFILIILGIVSKPASIIFSTFLSPNPSTSIPLKNNVIFLFRTVLSSSLFFNIISTCVLFHIYSTVGINGCSAGVMIDCIFGITSPLRIICITAPTPILFFSIKEPLNPVAYDILTPPKLTGSNRTRGLR